MADHVVQLTRVMMKYNSRSRSAAYKSDVEYNVRSCISHKCALYMFTVQSVVLQTALPLDKKAW